MKKQTFLSLFFSITTFFASAQSGITAITFDPADTSISWNSVRPKTQVFASGAYFDAYGYSIKGDTAIIADTTSQNYSPLLKLLSGLPADTPIQLWGIVWKSADTIRYQTDTVSFRTKPLPQQTMLTWLRTIPGLPSDTIWFHYQMISQTTPVFVLYQNDFYTTDTILLAGIGDTFVLVTDPNVPTATYANNALIGLPNALLGISPAFELVPPFTVPGFSMPSVSSLQMISRGQDSILWQASITKGNVPIAAVSAISYDSLGHAQRLADFTSQSDTSFYVVQRNLPPETWHTLSITIADTGGMDSLSSKVQTLPWNPPLITNWIPHDSTDSQTHLTVFGTDGGNHPIATTSMSVRWQDTSGAWHQRSVIFVGDSALENDFTIDSLQAGSARNTLFLYMQNAGGADSETISIVIASPPPLRIELAPTLSDQTSVNPAAMTVAISWTVTAANDTIKTATYAQRNDGVLDSVIRTGITQSGNAIDTFATEGGFNYCLFAAATSADAIVSPTSDTLCAMAIAAINPQMQDAIYTPSVTTCVAEYIGNGGGNDCELTVTLSTGPLNDIVFTASVGTGQFDTTSILTGLEPNIEYTPVAKLKSGMLFSELSKSFWTNAGTASGIAEVPPNAQNVFVRVVNILGQKLFSRIQYKEASNLLSNLPRQIFFVTPVDDDGNPIPGAATRKIEITED